MFADGYRQLLQFLASRRYPAEPRAALAKLVGDLVQFSSDDVVRHQLLFQRTIPGFEPSEDSFDLALEFYTLGSERLAAAGVHDQADIDVFTALVSGLGTNRSPTTPGASAGYARRAGSSRCS
jgi:hypothetical protein